MIFHRLTLQAESPTLRLFLGVDPAFVLAPAHSGNATTEGVDLSSGSAGSVLLDATRCDARTLQPALQECRRVLRTDGRIGIVLQNPWWRAVRKFRGETVPIEAHGPSLRRLKSALHRAGFAGLEVFLMFASAQDLRYLRPRTLRRIWRSRHYLVTAGIGAHCEPSQLDAILRAVVASRTGGQDSAFKLHGVACSAKDKSICFVETSGSRLVVRIPHSETAAAMEANAYERIASLEAAKQLPGRIPQPMYRSVGGRTVFAETRVAGIPLAAVVQPANRAVYVGEVHRFLRELNGAPDAARSGLPQGDTAVRIDAPLEERVLACLDDPGLRRDARDLFATVLSGAECRLGLVHGDLSVSNIYVDDDRISGVIDWENCRDDAPLVLDALNYLDSVQRRCSGTGLAETVPLLASGKWPVECEAEFLHAYFAYCGADIRFLPGFALLYFLHHVEPQLGFEQVADGPRKNIEAVLKRLLR